MILAGHIPAKPHPSSSNNLSSHAPHASSHLSNPASSPSTPKKATTANLVDSNGFLDSLDDVDDSTFSDAEYKKRKRTEVDPSPEIAESTPTKQEMSVRTPKRKKTSDASTPSSSATSPLKTKRTPPAAKKPSSNTTAAELATPEKLAAINVPTLRPEDVTVMYASYGNFMTRNAPPMHGEKTIPSGKPDCLKSFVFVMTGVLESLERDEASDLITRLGGTVSKTLGKRVTHALVGADAGPTKINQIRERNIPMIDENGLFKLIRVLSGGDSEEEDSGESADGGLGDDAKLAVASSDSSIVSSTSSSSVSTIHKSPLHGKHDEVDKKAVAARSPPKTAKKSSAPVSLTVTLPSPVHPRISTMWTDKYAPVTSADLVGNPGNVSKLKSWLQSWDSNYDRLRSSTNESGKSTFAFPRCALLMGAPGVGKTCTALIIAKECGYIPIHLNASDQRSQSTLKEKVAGLLSNHGINEFFASSGSKKAKTVLLMDEIDGMSSGDRGGMAELTQMIKTTKVPIIAMANDKQKVRSLAQSVNVLPLGFSRPTLQQTFARMASIAANEGLTMLSEDTLRKIVESCHGDLRMTLNALQLLSANPGSLSSSSSSSSASSSALDSHLRSSAKDVTLGPFDVVPKIFGINVLPNGYAASKFDDRLEYYFVDYSIVPLFVFQNYLRCKIRGATATLPANGLLSDLRSVRRAVDSMCDADILSASIYSQQNFSLLPLHGVMSTVRPAAILNSHSTAVEFPQILGKGSTQRKRATLLGELQSEMYVATGGTNARGIGLDYMSVLVRELTEPLIRRDKDGIEPVMKFMETYGISKDGRESVIEIAELKYEKTQKDASPAARISGAAKSAFTRTYNATAHAATFKRKKKVSGAGEGEGEEEEMETMEESMPETGGAGAIEEEEEDNPENDSLISVPKAKKASGAARASKSTEAKQSKKKLVVTEDAEEEEVESAAAAANTPKLARKRSSAKSAGHK